ncbi:hypothetical protein FKR81_02135 [Lentzea tibetensis]|uniref:Uncharacterized protein n=1 Tax=Lentzea tibetensis TaxID=2591470 RepID=A0A563F323_9PSEU|nr:hypothetical protein [Lentzea tibetensis]TWP54367.1 hypothetical protein FKR81_02135 [Lentzea tibetensis]
MRVTVAASLVAVLFMTTVASLGVLAIIAEINAELLRGVSTSYDPRRWFGRARLNGTAIPCPVN